MNKFINMNLSTLIQITEDDKTLFSYKINISFSSMCHRTMNLKAGHELNQNMHKRIVLNNQ